MIHPSAVIHPSAELAPDVQVGPYVIIEGPARIGSGVRIEAHAQIVGRRQAGEEKGQIEEGRCGAGCWIGVVVRASGAWRWGGGQSQTGERAVLLFHGGEIKMLALVTAWT